jgi:hypothetical protein
MMQVIGHDLDGNEILGDVMGDVEGDNDVGRSRRRGRTLQLPPKAGWRTSQMAPGVIQPDEGMVPLPLNGLAGSPAGTFSASIPQITFQGQLQKPFRGERLLVSTVRVGTTAVGRLLTQFFVGTDMQQADIQGWDAELIGNPNSFGTRLTMKPAEPGVLIRAIVTLSSVLTTTDTIFANFTLLGRIIA